MVFSTDFIPDSQILKNMRSLLGSSDSGYPQISSAIAMALSYCSKQRIRNTDVIQKQRILCITASEDDPSQYISIMNCIFAAQASDIPIDVCRVTNNLPSAGDQVNSIQLQQASHITSGIYHTFKLDDKKALVHHLLQVFLPDPDLRKPLGIAWHNSVDFSASCFCHKKRINIAFVCPICLSIFCGPVEKCLTCGTDV